MLQESEKIDGRKERKLIFGSGRSARRSWTKETTFQTMIDQSTRKTPWDKQKEYKKIELYKSMIWTRNGPAAVASMRNEEFSQAVFFFQHTT